MDNKNYLEIEYLSKRYDETTIPLYLSYPTTSWWNQEADDTSFTHSYHNDNNPFLYFHFPYCKKACYYCCCYKETTAGDEKKETYIRYLEKEFLHKLHLLQVDRFVNVKHLHWGGGTPTYLNCSQIERIFASLAKKIDISDSIDSSISIEAYPDEEVLDFKKLMILRGLGFNEISFGIQDFDERIQKTINRDCSVESVQKIINQARELGFRIHIDLCYGLPFQGLRELETTVHHIIEMCPDRIAMFPYAHYPFLFPMQKRIPASSLPNSFLKVLLIKQAETLFDACGYKRIGIDHFVKPGNPLYKKSLEKKIIKDFMGYSVDSRRSFIGFGSSAISFLGNRYFHNTISLQEYYALLEQGRLPFKHNMAYTLSHDDIIRNRIIQKSILCDFMIDKKEIGSRYHIDFDDYFKRELIALQEYERDGLLETTPDGTILITPRGRYFSRHIAFVFDTFYRENGQQLQGNKKHDRNIHTQVTNLGGTFYELSTRIN